MAAIPILKFSNHAFPTSSICSISKSQCNIGNVSTNVGDDWSNTKEMTAVLRNQSCRQLSSCKVHFRGSTTITRNEFIIRNFQSKNNFYWCILTSKGSLLFGVLMLKRLFARNLLSPDFYGSKFGGVLDRRPIIVNLKAPNPEKVHVSIGTRLLIN